MQSQNINFIQNLFQSRLATLKHILNLAQNHFDNDSFLEKRIIADMLPLGTQIAFTCNQPRNFALWCDSKPADNLDQKVSSLEQAYEHISNTTELLANINIKNEKLDRSIHIELGQGQYIELSGSAYLNDFLIPNFYFHLVTTYDILRMAGVPIGKKDYMLHLLPFVRQA
ncbi:hypothetical protein Xen7305DRAFT_00028550 [Xenococcus sp. PCC 7305]|uniref:DUF1993 domain-containing protein n=1 Tax=Xenococcus sp. PCC 7305 TaxID=102125 RepID=UPI0002ACF0E3|nr:DUF1993 domain-containing protein [Xenococcus sp. PCC 7305]ELS03135.1 hypothetical protein Xen7305DRAFT_00028550 [Xenococcus sp. PCC 7305]